jgi:methylated-DNA-[protein]-cysteine S-methyltransferase
MKNHASAGPLIRVQFFLGKDGIDKVELSLGSGKGFEWEVISSSSKQALSQRIEEWLENYCQKRQTSVELPLNLKGLPPYTTRILSILKDIPFGVGLSYESLAEISGNPRGARAVGNACAKNPFPLLIPCHRVLSSQGRLGGFSCGLDIKRNLLNFEGISYLSSAR